MSDWITTTEASKISGYTLYHLRDLIHGGKIKAQKFGRDWQIDRKSLLAYTRSAAEIGAKRGPKPKSTPA